MSSARGNCGMDEHDGRGNGPGVGSDGPDALEALVMEYLDRADGRDDQAVLEDLCKRHPDQADGLRRRIAILGGLGVLPGAGVETSGRVVPERLGGFRILRELGTGGMGVVYLAMEEDLGREVALKVIRPDYRFFAGARERFRREVETVARLQHPGIVPVFAVGEEDGVPYFAMERVDGRSLEDVIGRLRERDADPSELQGRDLAAAAGSIGDAGWLFTGTWEQACLRVVRQLAEALEHAHQRGVLHRDIKPSNVMLATGSSGSQAKLLDFGLATSGDERSLTGTGSRLGSLPYMAPEQTRGELATLSPATDVYALGVTLYELLTLRRPFGGTNEAETLLAIQRGGAAAPRDRNPILSWEAETVCLKAMEPDPSRRYARAADLAHDLGSVLDRRPLEARRAGPWLRARRWVQRHPTATVGAALTIVLLVGVPLGYAFLQGRANRALRLVNVDLSAALDLAEERRQQAVHEAGRAEANFERALEAVDRMLAAVGEERLEFVPQMQPVRLELLDDAIAFYAELLAQRPDDLQLRREHLRLGRVKGDVLVALGRDDEAEAEFRSQIVRFRELVAAAPDDWNHRYSMAGCMASLAKLLRFQGREAEAAALVDEALTTYRGLLTGAPDHEGVRHDLAVLLGSKGALVRTAGDPEAALPFYSEAIEVVRPAAAIANSSLREEYRTVLAGALVDQADALLGLLHFDEAEAAYAEASDLMDDVVRATGRPDHKLIFARVASNFSNLLTEQGRDDEAVELLVRARDMLAVVVDEEPAVEGYRRVLAALEINLASALGSLGRDDESRTQLEAADVLLQRLVADSPGRVEYVSWLGTVAANLAAIAVRSGDVERGLALGERAIGLQEQALSHSPSHPPFRLQLAEATLGRASALAAACRHVEAAQAVAPVPELSGELPSVLLATAEMLASCARCAEQDGALGDERRAALLDLYRATAVELLRLAVERGLSDPMALRTNPELGPLRDVATFKDLLQELSAHGM